MNTVLTQDLAAETVERGDQRALLPHTGDEMEMLTTVGELIGCRVTMARLDSGPESINYSELALRTLPAEQAP